MAQEEETVMAEELRNQDGREEQGPRLASGEELKGRRGEARRGGNRRFAAMTAVLLLALAAAVGIWLVSKNETPAPAKEQKTETAERAEKESVTLVERPRSEVAEVTVETGGESYTVVNASEENAAYTLKDLPYFDADQQKAGAVITCASALTANRIAAENVEDPEPFGLKEPVSRVTMSYRDGTENVWLVGAKAPTSTASYFMREGEKTVYLLYASAAESLSRRRGDMHTLRLPGTINSNLIRSLLVEAPGADNVEIGYSEAEADKNYNVSALRLRQPFYYTASVERASELFNGLAGLTLTAYAGEAGELTDAGLAQGAYRKRVTVTQRKESGEGTETFVFHIGGFTEDKKSVYLRVDDTEAVYLAEAAALSFLEKATPAYLADSFSNLIYINAVDEIEITSGEEKWTLGILHAEDEKTFDLYTFNGRTVRDEDAFKKLYQRIVGMTNSRISEDYHLEGDVVLSVRYRLNVEPGEVLVEYLNADENYCAVRRDGLTLFLIKRDQVEGLREALKRFGEENT